MFHVSPSNPRRKLQLRYLTEIAKLPQVPKHAIVDTIPQRELTFEEAMVLVRLRGILPGDYLMPDVDVAFAIISHGVSFHADKKDGILQTSIARRRPQELARAAQLAIRSAPLHLAIPS